MFETLTEMFSKKPRWDDYQEDPVPYIPRTEENTSIVRAVINHKLYDTSKAQKICDIIVPSEELSGIPLTNLFGKHVTVYKGNVEYFIVGYSTIVPVDEQWVREWLGKRNVEKYIELFGKPELA
nr:MAG TPA_asm: hypothetical protein [Caudoviricetes sp.]